MMCSICHKTDPAIAIVVSHDDDHESGETIQHFCLLHYYGSDASRLSCKRKRSTTTRRHSQTVVVHRLEPHFSHQLPSVQALFAHVFLDVQSELEQHLQQEEKEEKESSLLLLQHPHPPTLSSFTRKKSHHPSNHDEDPLAILHALSSQPRSSSSSSSRSKTTRAKSSRTSKNSPSPIAEKGEEELFKTSGGFFKESSCEQVVLHAQHLQQHATYHALEQRIHRELLRTEHDDDNNNAPPPPPPPPSPSHQVLRTPTTTTSYTQRRRPSRKSIWNTVLEEEANAKKRPPACASRLNSPSISSSSIRADSNEEDHDLRCSSCSSTHVRLVGTRSSRGNDLCKGETWGNKEANDQVWNRYQCLQCGKIWNEEE